MDYCVGTLVPQGRYLELPDYQTSKPISLLHLNRSLSIEEVLGSIVATVKSTDPELALRFQESIDAIVKKQVLRVRYTEKRKFNTKPHSVYRPFRTYFSLTAKERFTIQLDWPTSPIRTENELFLAQETAIRAIYELQYIKLTQLNGLKYSPSRLIKKNLTFIRDKVLLQYALNGHDIDPTIFHGITQESASIFKKILLGTLVPWKFSSMKLTNLHAGHAWALEHFGIHGLTRYLYITQGPSIGLRYALISAVNLKSFLAVSLAVLLTPTVYDINKFYSTHSQYPEMTVVERSYLETAIQEFDASAAETIERSQKALNAKEIDSDSLTPTLDSMSATERKRYEELLKQLQKDLTQDASE